MATTMKLIAKTTLGSDAASVTFGSGNTIPQTYTDLLLVVSARSARASFASDPLRIRFNGASADTNMSVRTLFGTGSGAFSDTNTYVYIQATASTATADVFGSAEVYIANYAGSTAKSISTTTVTENNATAARIEAHAGLWNDTAAITQIDLTSVTSSDIKSGSSFFLYGITKSA